MSIQVFVLSNLFIFFKCYIPVLLIHGRQGTHDRFPFRDRKTGTGEPGYSTQQYLYDDHEYTNKQPGCHWS